MQTKLSSGLALVVGLALFVAVNMFAGTALRFARADLTQNNLYTLSDGTRRILGRLDEPITVRLFYSAGVASELPPQFDVYARRVRELLEEFERAADGKLVLQVIDPEPYSEAEELAQSFGVRGDMINTAGDTFFFGIAATNSVDEREVVPSLDPRGESTLEYDLAKLVHDLSLDTKPKVAVLSSLPLNGGQPMFPGQPAQQPWQVVQLLQDSFEVEFLDAQSLAAPLAEDTAVLVLVHPKALPPPAQFAVDQYALAGGKVLALVDAYCYFEPTPPGQQNQFGVTKTSELDTLLGAWGVELVPDAVAGDWDLARTVRSGNQLLPFPLWMELNAQLDPALFAADDFVTAELGLVNLFCTGSLRAKEGGTTAVTPLLSTTTAGRTIEAVNLQFARDPLMLAETLAPQFRPVDGEEGERVTLAVRVSGPVTTAFPDGAPEGWEGAGEVLTESSEPFNALIVADADFINEQLWTSQQMTQIGMLQRVNNNPVLILNAIENLTGSNDLLSLRARGVFRRPFEKKDELAKAARERFLAKDQELESKIRELEAEIRDLQKGADEQGVVRITMQEFEALSDKQQERLELGRERNRVQYELKKDIESLGARLKLLNIFAVPALVALAGVAFHLTRRRRHQA